MLTAKHISIVAFTIGFLINGLQAQTATGDQAGPETLQQRMQRSVSRQLDSASRMQASLDMQRQSAQRQTGDVSPATPFFTLPAPARMTPRRMPIMSEQPIESADGDSAEHNNSDLSPDSKAEPAPPSDAPPAHLMPLVPIAGIGIPGIAGIAGIAGISGIAAGGLTTGGMIAGNALRIDTGDRQDATAGAAAPRNAGVPHIQQLLQALGADGTGGLPSLLGPQQAAAANYSGRDNAPLTSFSLVDWLFGL